MILSDNSSSKLIYSPVRNSLVLISLRSCIDMYRSTWAAYSCWLLVQFSCSVLSHSLLTNGPPGAYSNSCPLSQWCFPTICLLLLPSILPRIRVFCNESFIHIRWPKYWGFNFSISPSNEYSGLISFRMDWLDLFAVQGTLKSLLQHYSSKASILRCS